MEVWARSLRRQSFPYHTPVDTDTSNAVRGEGRPSGPLANLSDEALIEGHALGNDGYFLEIVRRYQDGLFRLILRMVQDPSDAQDVLQDVLVQAHVAAHQFDPTRRAKPWLFTIAANRARDLLRKRKRTRMDSVDQEAPHGGGTMVDLLQTSLPDPADLAEKEDAIRRLRQGIAKLSPAQAAVIELAFLQQMPYQQISEVLGIPVGTVKSRVHSGVAFLSHELNSSNPHSRAT
jgi:RNA polymerase sigma-70 factor, ECF subfamily